MFNMTVLIRLSQKICNSMPLLSVTHHILPYSQQVQPMPAPRTMEAAHIYACLQDPIRKSVLVQQASNRPRMDEIAQVYLPALVCSVYHHIEKCVVLASPFDSSATFGKRLHVNEPKY